MTKNLADSVEYRSKENKIINIKITGTSHIKGKTTNEYGRQQH